MDCKAKHTKFQPTDEQWKCPKCGGTEDFYIDYFADGAEQECTLLHVHDYVVCEDCGKSWGGGTLAPLLMKAAGKVPCPCCKGTGFVDAGASEKGKV